MQSHEFGASDSKGFVFGLGSRSGNGGLLFRTPRNEVISKENTKSSGRLAVINGAGPIGITICIESKGGNRLEEETMRDGAFEVTKYVFNGCPMSSGRRLHELRDPIDRKGNIGTCKGGILKSTDDRPVEMRIIELVTIKSRKRGLGNHGRRERISLVHVGSHKKFMNVLGL